MTYLRMRKSHRTQPGLALTQLHAEASTEIRPVEEQRPREETAPGQETQPRAAAVTTKPRRSLADPAISEGQSRGGPGRAGTLHKPVHAR